MRCLEKEILTRWDKNLKFNDLYVRSAFARLNCQSATCQQFWQLFKC